MPIKIKNISEFRKKGNSNDTIDIIRCSFDIMTSVYYSRAINFNSYNYNDTIPLNIILDKQVFKNLNIIYKGKEVVINQNKKKINYINCHLILIP